MSWAREEMLEALTTQSPVMLVVLEGPEMWMTFATQPVRELMNHELVGHSLRDVLPQSPALAIIERVQTTGVAETVSDTPLFSGRLVHTNRFFTRTFTPLKDQTGTVRSIAIHAVETTAEVRARTTLETSEQRLRGEFERVFALFEEAPIGLSVVEPPRWKFTLANRKARATYGAVDLTGRNFADMVPPDNATLAMLERVCSSGRPASCEVVGQAPGFEGRAFALSMGAIQASDGTTTGILVAAFDLTEQRRVQQELERAREEAVAAAGAKDQFLAMLGHELRNPLQPMLTGVQLLRLDGVGSPALDMLEREVSYVTRLVEDLLDISRISRGTITLKREATSISSIIDRGLELTSPLLEETGHRVKIEIGMGTIIVSGDPHRLAQVVSNLLANAAKYSPPESTIRVTAERTENRVVLRIADQGVGITPEMLPRVFDAFVQGEQPLDRSRSGLGIGLSIVKNLVEAHGGSVSAQSDGLGRGSTFTVEIPLLEVAAEPTGLDRTAASRP